MKLLPSELICERLNVFWSLEYKSELNASHKKYNYYVKSLFNETSFKKVN